jgi:choline dehydrogenase
MSLGASQVAMFAKSMEGLETPDIQFHFQPLVRRQARNRNAPEFSASLHRSASFGRKAAATFTSPRPDGADYPKITPNYLSAIADQLARCAR